MLLDAVVDYLPSPLDDPAGGRHQPQERGDHHPRAGRRRALLGHRLQDHVRPVRRQGHLLPGVLRHAQSGLLRVQLEQGQERARRPHPADARQPPRGHHPGVLRRHRGGCGPQGHHHRQHPLRRRPPDRARVHRVPRAGHLRGHRAQDQGRPGQTGREPHEAGRRRPHLPRPHGRGDRARPSSPVWASSIWRSSSTACSASSKWTPTSAARRWPTARASPSRSSRPRLASSARPAAAASTATSSSR